MKKIDVSNVNNIYIDDSKDKITKVGRKQKNESYRNIRASTLNNIRMRSLENVLGITSHNDLLNYMINDLEKKLEYESPEKLRDYKLLLKVNNK